MFDRSFLPEAQIEFVVISDTHYILASEIHFPNRKAPDPFCTYLWSARTDLALQLVSALAPAFVVHLGDLTQEYPGKDRFVETRAEAREQLEHFGFQIYHAAGNMDIGDKPNPLVPAPWVRAQDLQEWHAQFGLSWYSFDQRGVHFVVLNSQIMGGPLTEAEVQKRWLEEDLSDHHGKRIFVFLHLPPYFVDEQEPGLGSYNCLDEQARVWLLNLLRKHDVEFLFSGHIHFAAFNRIGHTRHYAVPSTSFSRPGFGEVFPILPDHRGKNDVDKLGFYFARVREDGVRMHLIRTNGEVDSLPTAPGNQILLTRTSHDLPRSPLGVYLRSPLAPVTPGVLAWPDSVRQRVRNDYPFLACLELGVRHLRAPASDLQDGVQAARMEITRKEGIQLTVVWIWSESHQLVDEIELYQDQIDSIEIQLAGALLPGERCMKTVDHIRNTWGIPVTFAPLLARVHLPGAHHPRIRLGYHPSELEKLNHHLSREGLELDRALCHVGVGENPWNAILEFRDLLPLSYIENIDLVVQIHPVDEHAGVIGVTESLFASALIPTCRIFLDPFVDVDRSTDTNLGLLDRLSNPRPAFQAARCLNTILFGSEETYQPMEIEDQRSNERVLGIASDTRQIMVHLPEARISVTPIDEHEALVERMEGYYVNLKTGTSQTI